MTHLIKGRTRADAWIEAMNFILSEGDQLNLLLDISEPLASDTRHKKIVTELDRMCESRPKPQATVNGVAETIFPFWDYTRYGFDVMSQRYLTNFQALKQAMQWGTYAHRMLERPLRDGTIVNPLKIMINKMSHYHNGRGSTYGRCYEIGITDNVYELPLYRIDPDRNRPYSGPCLSHLSFKLDDGTVHLAALYRSSDYGYKTYGNLLGLSRLHYAIAKEVGADVGSMCVLSTMAMTDAPKTPLRALINDLNHNIPKTGD